MVKSIEIERKDSLDLEQCASLYHKLGREEIPLHCRELLHLHKDTGIENHSMNVKGSFRPKGGVSHAMLQRRFTGGRAGTSSH